MKHEFTNPITGKPMKSILPDEVLSQISDLIETDLKAKDIYYEREGNIFRVPEYALDILFEAQWKANCKLVDQGVITMQMLQKDAEENGALS